MSAQEGYIVVEEFGIKDADDLLTGGLLYEQKTVMALPVLNYQFGYLRELHQTLTQYAQSNVFEARMFPLIWLEQPFDIVRDINGTSYGRIDSLRIFICMGTDINYTAKERLAINYKPILYPLYRGLLNAIDNSLTFTTQSPDQIEHTVSDRYFWGEEQDAIFGYRVDCIVVNLRNLVIANKQICLPLKSW